MSRRKNNVSDSDHPASHRRDSQRPVLLTLYFYKKKNIYPK